MERPRSKIVVGILIFIVSIVCIELFILLANPFSQKGLRVSAQGNFKIKNNALFQEYLKKIDFGSPTSPVLVWDTDKTFDPTDVKIVLVTDPQKFDKAITEYNGKPTVFHSFGQEYKDNVLTVKIQFLKDIYPTRKEADLEFNKYIIRAIFLNNHPTFFKEPALQKQLQNILDEYSKSPQTIFESNNGLLNISFEKGLRELGELLIPPVSAGCTGTFTCGNQYTTCSCSTGGSCTTNGASCGPFLAGTCNCSTDCGDDVVKNCSFFGNQDTCTNDRGACSQNQCLQDKSCSWYVTPTSGPPATGTPSPTPTPPPAGGGSCTGTVCGSSCCHAPEECISTDGPLHCGVIVGCTCDVATCDYSGGNPGRCVTRTKACKFGGCSSYTDECYPDNGSVNPQFCPGAFEASSCSLSSPDAVFVEPVGTTVFTAYESENEIGGLIRCNKPTYTTQCGENNTGAFNQDECFGGNNCSGKVKAKSTGDCVMTVSCENGTILCSSTTKIYNPTVRGRTYNPSGTQLFEIKNISRITCPSNLQGCSLSPSTNNTSDEIYSKGDISSGYVGIKITTIAYDNTPLVVQDVNPSVSNGIELPNCAGANTFCYLWPASSFGTVSNSPTATRTVNFILGAKPTGAPVKGKVFSDTNNNTVLNGADDFLRNITFLISETVSPFFESLKDSTATGDADNANLDFGNLPNSTYSLSAPLSNTVAGVNYSLLRCGDVVEPNTLPTPGNIFACARANGSLQLKTWSTSCTDNLCNVTNDEVVVDGQQVIVNLPYVTSTPTPIPTQGPWTQLKNTSYQTVSSLKQTVPAGAQAYDTDATSPYSQFVLGQQGVLLGNITPTPPSNGWFTASYNPSIFFDTATFIQYARSRKNVETITNPATMDEDGIYYHSGTSVTLDNLSGLPNGSNAVLMINGTVTFSTNAFNDNVANPSRPRMNFAVIANKIIFPDSMTKANGIFIANTIDLSQSQTGTINTPLKIYGNLVSRTSSLNIRTQNSSNNMKPSIFVVVDYNAYAKLLPYLSIANYDRKEIE